MPVTLCFLCICLSPFSFPLVVVARSVGEIPPTCNQAIDSSQQIRDQPLGVACEHLCACCCVCVCVCIRVGDSDIIVYACCLSFRPPQFMSTELGRGGIVCVSVGGEAGVLGVVGFWWLTPKLFILLHSDGLLGVGGHVGISTRLWARYVLNWSETTRWEGSEEKMGVGTLGGSYNLSLPDTSSVPPSLPLPFKKHPQR